ncbi:MAG: TRAP transporter substrate-binding protein [Alphaproteobacteria bacterium]|nr:TRAP transporter substrate-binding protein [Alphaproteobacteria bacterium]
MTSDPIQIRMGGYGPPTTTHSRALKFIGDRLESQFGNGVDIKYVWNIMDFGYRADEILWLTECGILTMSYQSTSYLTDRVPELGFVDLPFLFDDLDHARGAFDGDLGAHLNACIEREYNYRMLGYFENGFRHISNRLRPIHLPADLKDMKIRMLPSDTHVRTFEMLGAEPLRMDLTEAIEGVVAGTLDAQENPLANTVTYGVHKHHPFHTLSGHFYLSRGVYGHRESVDGWPEEMRAAMHEAVRDATEYQRGLAVAEEDISRQALEDENCEIVELTDDERAEFRAAVAPMHDEARAQFGDEMFGMVGR